MTNRKTPSITDEQQSWQNLLIVSVFWEDALSHLLYILYCKFIILANFHRSKNFIGTIFTMKLCEKIATSWEFVLHHMKKTTIIICKYFTHIGGRPWSAINRCSGTVWNTISLGRTAAAYAASPPTHGQKSIGTRKSA